MLTPVSPIYKSGEGYKNHPSYRMTANKSGAISVQEYLEYLGTNQAVSRRDTYGGLVTGKEAELASFNRYSIPFADDEMSSSLGYVFIVRPDLNIIKSATDINDLQVLDQVKTNLFTSYMTVMDPAILMSLTQSLTGSYSHQFISILFDRVEEYQIPSVELATHEMVQPFSGYKTVYAGNTHGSQSGCQFEISFRETADLRITKLFQVWISYIDGITLNLLQPKDEYLKSKFVAGSQVIDYATSIYFVRTKPTGEIIFFHKITGAFPTQIPINQQSYNRGGSPDNKISVNFVGGYPESFNPVTIAEFNYNSTGGTFDIGELAPDYDPEGFGGNSGTGDIFTGSPLIFYKPIDGALRFYLAWQKYEGYIKGQGAGLIPNNVPQKWVHPENRT